ALSSAFPIRMNSTSISRNSELVIIYDGECPFCSRYVELVRLREAVGSVRLLNARETAVEEVRELHKLGYDLNEGMIAKYQGRIYHGADCVNLLARLSTESGTINRINRALFVPQVMSRLLYPLLRFGRNLTLRCLG